jgi:hypothetical protein
MSQTIRFNRPWEDGYGFYNEGQVVEMQDRERAALYLTKGYAVPATPPAPKRNANLLDSPLATYVFLSPHATFAVGQEYTLPVPRGDKYVARELAIKVV